MNLKEFLEANGVVTTRSYYDESYKFLENVINKNVWVCDFRLNENRDLKPIRKIKPTLVQVFSNDYLPKNKHIYYSPIHFRVIKKDIASSTIIAPYDNTGYRIHTGVSLNIFDTKDECIKHFRIQCAEAMQNYQDELTWRIMKTQDRIDEIQKMQEAY